MQSIYKKLKRLLEKTGLSENESRMIVASLVFPGLSTLDLGKQCGFKKMTIYRTIDALLEKRYLIAVDKDNQRRIYPISLKDIARRIDQKFASLRRFALEIEDINKLLLYPLNTDQENLKIDKYFGDEAKEMFYDMHYYDWNHIFGGGDLDSYLGILGMDFEKKWLDIRVKKGKTAEAIFTTNGEITKEFIKNDKNELRVSKFIDSNIRNRWFTFFPEANTTLVFRADDTDNQINWNILKIESKEITDNYLKFFQFN